MSELKTLKDTMIELIKKSAEFNECFIFETLQDYMDLSDPSNPKWISNVRLRMWEISEAVDIERNRQRQKAIKWLKSREPCNELDWIKFFNITEEELK